MIRLHDIRLKRRFNAIARALGRPTKKQREYLEKRPVYCICFGGYRGGHIGTDCQKVVAANMKELHENTDNRTTERETETISQG